MDVLGGNIIIWMSRGRIWGRGVRGSAVPVVFLVLLMILDVVLLTLPPQAAADAHLMMLLPLLLSASGLLLVLQLMVPNQHPSLMDSGLGVSTIHQ